MEGHCQCGQIRFTTPTPKPTVIYVCHCTECRHQSSSTHGMTAVFPFFDIRQFAPAGHPAAIAIYSRPNPTGRTDGYFCTNCGSRLVHVHVSHAGETASTLSVKSGCLDGVTKEMTRAAVHIWTRSAVVDIPVGVARYEEDPPYGSFEGSADG